jgi:hypothetical protein
VASNTNQGLMGSGLEATGKESTSSFEMMMLNLQQAEGATLASEERIAQSKKKLDNEIYKYRRAEIEKTAASEEERVTQLAALEKELTENALAYAQKLETNLYKYSSKQSKIKMLEDRSRTAKAAQYEIQQRLNVFKVMRASGEQLNADQIAEEQELIKRDKQASDIQIKNEQTKRKLIGASLQEQKKYGAISKSVLDEQFAKMSESFELEKGIHDKKIADLNGEIAALEEREAAGDLTDDERQELEEKKAERDSEVEVSKKVDKERFGNELLANTMKAGFNALEGGLSKIADGVNQAVNAAIDTVGQYKSFIDARLQATDSNYSSVAKTLKSTLAISPFVKQTEVLKKLNDAVDKGIAYNVEQRAFLATMTDKIVSTFDAFDANLMRIIRLQQADTTAARMGMESNLLQFFNSTFSDNSYLQEGYDTVSQALVDANAQMTRDMSISFEFNVQKWMGSLASLGFGTDTIQTIAQGINYLGSGNVQALAGNTQLQSLLAMSASRAGLSYSDLLVKGIDDSSVNELLKSMVEYLAEIAEDENAVVKAAYGDVFNFTQADLRAIKNLTESDIANISNQTMSYDSAMNEIQSQLLKVSNRLSTSEMIDNVFDNFMYSTAESMANNPVTALMWKTISTIEEATGGVELPFINVMGFGLDLNMSIESLLKTGMFGLSALGQVGNMASSLMSGGGLSLDAWGGSDYTKRGGNFTSTVGGVQSSTSGSRAMTSASSSDTKKQALAETEEDQESQKKSSKEMMKDEITLETLYKELFEKKTAVYTIDNPVREKMGEIVASAIAVKNRADDIYKVLSNSDTPLRVTVSNLDSMATFIPKMPSKIGVSEIDEKTLNTLASKITTGVVGKSNDGGNAGEAYTISDLVNILLNGTIMVSDKTTNEHLREINRNLV